jgi:hypothetical protein
LFSIHFPLYSGVINKNQNFLSHIGKIRK